MGNDHHQLHLREGGAMKHPSLQSFQGHSQLGLSLVELLVAMTIGIVIIGVGFSSYLNVSAGSRQASAMAQMTNDASLALAIMRNHVAMAGYSAITGTQANGSGGLVAVKAYGGGSTLSNPDAFISGCARGFTSTTADTFDIHDLACNSEAVDKDGKKTGADSPDGLAVTYQADDSTTYADAANATDCLGNNITATGGIFIASNRFYIASGNNMTGLFCKGNGSTAGNATSTGQMIVENITDLRVSYGLTPINPATNQNRTAVSYLDADQIKTLGAGGWARVVSARICVQVESALSVPATEQPKYLNCEGQYVNNSTGHYVRTFTTTVVLHNRAATSVGS
jgi:type IV pilus assembly protein PilW